ncbi:PucR family transcriptional regulator ligand-binding domain-containing protein [Streptomyces sp. LHD-70]|uniref:PucR family transcriptional regulator n=1 Tax=Streptomyces sp. LHD-70 TaxID=3072140 RepID=UPI00281054C4|nr:PucR family transcriptional regulator ligand-binding domain-containing protein [Streptomyces sp. LHD-70]MDQ8704969.1 PucR family transcriptional regulator ligand-binding domain-containing protein [Streptomyces sp. LHD-70]
MTVSRVLAHPSLAPARPRILTGSEGLDRTVRWIHSSEVLAIAPLLRGGELLLTGGSTLARAGESQQRSYIQSLSDRAVAGVAIETGAELAEVPPALLAEASGLGFPVIELRRVVPFVEVAEVINASLVDDSVVRLRSAGALSHEMSGVLADGGGTQEVLDTLARHVSVGAALFDPAGRVIATSGSGGVPEPELPHAPVPEPELPHAPSAMEAPLTLRGVPTATLVLYPGAEADVALLELAQDRAVEALQLALLRTRPPGVQELAAGELVRLAAGENARPQRIRRLGESLRFPPDGQVIGVAVQAAGRPTAFQGLEGVLARHGRTAIDMPSPLGIHALVSLRAPRRSARGVRARLIAELTEWSAGRTAIAVGPTVPELADAAVSLRAAMECLRQPGGGFAAGVVDASEQSVERLLLDDSFRGPAERLVREQLGPILALRDGERELLLTTLSAYFETSFNKTRTAADLHLQRQSLYARLRRAFDLLGGDPTGTPRALPLHLALRLYRHVL